MTVSYERPVEATLMVKLSNGEMFEASGEDLSKFGYIKKLDAYMNFNNHVDKVLREAGLLEDREDLTDTPITSLRYIVELACNYPELLDDPEIVDVNENIVKMVKILIASKFDIDR